MTSLNSHQRNILLGGALIAGGIAACYLLFSKSKNKANKQLIIQILKDTNREMYSILTEIAVTVAELKQETRGKLSTKEVREILLGDNLPIKGKIKNIQDTVYKQHDIEEKDFRLACETTFKDDKEVQALLKQAEVALNKAFDGIPPEMNAKVPSILTAELTLNVLTRTKKEMLAKIQALMSDIKSKGGQISFANPEVRKGLEGLNLESIRDKILVEIGLDKFEDNPVMIFQSALRKYANENPEFARKIVKLESQNQQAMEALMLDSPDALAFVEAVGV